MAKGVPQGAAFAYETAMRALDEQLRRIDALDAKAGILLAADGIIVGLVVGGGSLAHDTPAWITSLAGAAVLVSLMSAVGALLNQNYAIAPEPQTVAVLASASDEWIRWRVIGNVLGAVDGNRRKLRRKAQALTFGQLALLVGVGVFGGYFIVQSLTRGA